jgi:hypothetical protein
VNLSGGNNIAYMKGKRFSQMFTEKISPKSNMGKLFQALSGQPIPENTAGFPFDGWIDTEFIALIGESQNGQYAVVNPEGIETGKTVLSPAVAAYFNGSAPPSKAREPELTGVGAAGPGVDDDPFLQDDL